MAKTYRNRVFNSSDQPVYWYTPTPDSSGTYYPGAGTFGVDTSDFSSEEVFQDTSSLSVRDFGAVGDGTTDDYEAINTAITEIGVVEERGLVFPPGTYYIGTSLTITPNITSVFESGSVVTDDGDTAIYLTINGPVSAAFGQHFDFTGLVSSVIFGEAAAFSTDVRASWFGLTETGLQTALSSGATSVYIDGDLTITNGVTYPDKITIHGHTMGRFEGSRPTSQITFDPSSNNTVCFQQEDAGSATAYNVFFRDLYIWANSSTRTGIKGIKFEDVRYGGCERVTFRFNSSYAGTNPLHINADFSYCTGLRFVDCRFTGETNVLSDQDGVSNNTEITFESCHFRSNAYGLDIQNGINYLVIGCDFQASTTTALRVANKGLSVIKNFFENNNVGIEFDTGGSNAILLGNGYNINTTDVVNSNDYSYVRIDPREDSFVVGSLNIRADEETGNTTRMNFPTSGQAAANDWYVYDENASEYAIWFDYSDDILRSEKGFQSLAAVVEFTTDGALTAQQSGSTVTNRSASGSVTVDLPEASIGITFTFCKTEAQTFRINPAGTSDLIRGGGFNKYLELTNHGDSITLTCTRNNIYEIISSHGAYTIEP